MLGSRLITQTTIAKSIITSNPVPWHLAFDLTADFSKMNVIINKGVMA